jgi:RNA polymerase sigma-70 factor (ECF subfamily)
MSAARGTPAPRLAQPPRDTAADDLLTRVGHGDRDAFEELYRRTAPQVFGLVSIMLGDTAVAEEMSVAVYQQLWQTAARYDPAHDSVTAWVLGVAHGHAAAYLRAHRKTAVPAAAAAEELAPLSAISLPAGLERLDASSRELVLLLYYRGYSAAQAASLLRLPADTAPPRLHAALSRI